MKSRIYICDWCVTLYNCAYRRRFIKGWLHRRGHSPFCPCMSKSFEAQFDAALRGDTQ